MAIRHFLWSLTLRYFRDIRQPSFRRYMLSIRLRHLFITPPTRIFATPVFAELNIDEHISLYFFQCHFITLKDTIIATCATLFRQTYQSWWCHYAELAFQLSAPLHVPCRRWLIFRFLIQTAFSADAAFSFEPLAGWRHITPDEAFQPPFSHLLRLLSHWAAVHFRISWWVFSITGHSEATQLGPLLRRHATKTDEAFWAYTAFAETAFACCSLAMI